jgi:FKBP-type peptidyl-prolyl cis-trans isomerase
MKQPCITILIMGLLAAQATSADEPQTLTSQEDKRSYSFGQNIGYNLKRQGVQINLEVLIKGMTDAFFGNKPLLEASEMNKILRAFEQKRRAKQTAAIKALADKNLQEGEKFLAENAKKDGVVSLPSGLQYKVITPGTGKTPKATDKVTTHYRGTLINGTEFDSSYRLGKPASFTVNRIIKGWTEALQLMKEGANWQLFIPPKLAYGIRGVPGSQIGPNATLIVDIELLSVNDKAALLERLAQKNLKKGEKFLAKNAKKDGVVTLPSGLQYKVITPGTGKTPKVTDKVTTHYRGTLINGTEFDSSYKRGKPAQFSVNRVITGWQEALQLMKEGAKWQLFIPAKLAYKEVGSPAGEIGPNATLIFKIELISVDD